MRHRRILQRSGLAALLAIALAAGFTGGASAHETREVDGITFTVGFSNEPAYVNEMNGLELQLAQGEGDDAEPIEGAEQSLDATINFGEDTRDLELRAVFNEPGSYTADVIPTETGAYTFHITGEVDGVEIDESFQSGPDTFSEVNARDTLEFPGGEASASDDDQAAAFGIAGVAAGLLGLVAGVAGYYKATNNASSHTAGQRRQRPADE